MYDPCWLPSAIMQTTGALLGLYLIVYVYASQKLGSPIKAMQWSLLFSLFLGFSTIFVNTIWLRWIIKYPHKVFPNTELLSLGLFFLMLICLVIFTIVTIIGAERLAAFMEKVKRRPLTFR